MVDSVTLAPPIIDSEEAVRVEHKYNELSDAELRRFPLEELWDVERVMQHLGVSRQSVYNLASRERYGWRTAKIGGGRVFVAEDVRKTPPMEQRLETAHEKRVRTRRRKRKKEQERLLRKEIGSVSSFEEYRSLLAGMSPGQVCQVEVPESETRGSTVIALRAAARAISRTIRIFDGDNTAVAFVVES